MNFSTKSPADAEWSVVYKARSGIVLHLLVEISREDREAYKGMIFLMLERQKSGDEMLYLFSFSLIYQAWRAIAETLIV